MRNRLESQILKLKTVQDKAGKNKAGSDLFW
jgi:hypothetical protein